MTETSADGWARRELLDSGGVTASHGELKGCRGMRTLTDVQRVYVFV